VSQASDDPRADVTLLERIASRDASAVAELYEQQSRLLYGLILRILKDRGEAEEVLQEVLVAVWTKAETYNVTLGSAVAWLVRIARNRAIDRLRSRNVRDRAVEAYPMPIVNDSPETGAVRSEQQRAVTEALNTLPADQRALIEDAYFLGLTHAELAARFRMPLGTVKTRIRAGMMALRQQLQEVVAER
jgi:RNA polymerase sigma factor (sigma-70 family)